MKRYILLLLLCCWSLSLEVYSQRQKKIIKVGCIDMQKIIDTVSSDRALKSILQNKQKGYLREAKLLSQDIKKLKTILEREKNNLSQTRREEILYEINNKQEQLRNYLKQKSEVLRRREQVLSQEILINIYNIIKKVSIREGYAMILEKGTAVVYAEDEIDITAAVLDDLKKEKRKLKNALT